MKYLETVFDPEISEELKRADVSKPTKLIIIMTLIVYCLG